MSNDNVVSSPNCLLISHPPPTLGARGTCSLEPPKIVDNKIKNNNKKLALRGQRIRKIEVKQSASGEPSTMLYHGGPCRQSQPPVEAHCPSPHCKAGPQHGLICPQQPQQQSPTPSQLLLLSLCPRGPSHLPMAAAAKSQDLPDPIPQQGTKAVAP